MFHIPAAFSHDDGRLTHSSRRHRKGSHRTDHTTRAVWSQDMLELLRLLRNSLSETIFVGERFLASDSSFFHGGQFEALLIADMSRTFSGLALLAKRLENFSEELGVDELQAASGRRPHLGHEVFSLTLPCSSTLILPSNPTTPRCLSARRPSSSRF